MQSPVVIWTFGILLLLGILLMLCGRFWWLVAGVVSTWGWNWRAGRGESLYWVGGLMLAVAVIIALVVK
jgi:hypothetical protein